MSISNISSQSAIQVQSLVTMRQQLEDLQRQLGTQKRADNYAGIGADRGLTVGLRTQLSSIAAFGSSIDIIGTRLQLSQTALSDIADAIEVVKSALPNPTYAIDQSGQTTDQKTAQSELDRMLSALNTRFGDQYIFSGQSPDRPATDTLEHILDGDGARAGLRQVISERGQADLGADGLGRLVISAAAGAISVAEDAAGSPFGFKLAAATTTITGAPVSGPTGSPPGITINLAGQQPSAGDTVSLKFNLPDGTSEALTLRATTTDPPGEGEFLIGADATETAANLQTTLTGAVGKLAQTALSAASAVAAANGFFNTDGATPPQRVAGPPFDTATSLVAGTSDNTVSWYTGENSPLSARATATTRVDTAMCVSYGMRANEQALSIPVANLAVFAAMTFSADDANGQQRYVALTQRLQANLSEPAGTQKITDIAAELTGAQTTMSAAKDRHTQTTAALSDLLDNVEGAPIEEVGAQILALQTSLQASLQTAALLADLSLVNYL